MGKISRYERTLKPSDGRSISIGEDDDNEQPPGLFQFFGVTYGGRSVEVTRENLATDIARTAAL